MISSYFKDVDRVMTEIDVFVETTKECISEYRTFKNITGVSQKEISGLVSSLEDLIGVCDEFRWHVGKFMLECRSLGRRTFAKMQRSIYENFEDVLFGPIKLTNPSKRLQKVVKKTFLVMFRKHRRFGQRDRIWNNTARQKGGESKIPFGCCPSFGCPPVIG